MKSTFIDVGRDLAGAVCVCAGLVELMVLVI